MIGDRHCAPREARRTQTLHTLWLIEHAAEELSRTWNLPLEDARNLVSFWSRNDDAEEEAS